MRHDFTARARRLQQKLGSLSGPTALTPPPTTGRNWRLEAERDRAVDADQQWNALALPFAVGPLGRIGRLSDKGIASMMLPKFPQSRIFGNFALAGRSFPKHRFNGTTDRTGIVATVKPTNEMVRRCTLPFRRRM